MVRAGRTGLLTRHLRPAAADLAEQAGDLIEPLRIIVQVGFQQPPHHVVVKRLQAGGDLAAALHVERTAQPVDDADGLADGFAFRGDLVAQQMAAGEMNAFDGAIHQMQHELQLIGAGGAIGVDGAVLAEGGTLCRVHGLS